MPSSSGSTGGSGALALLTSVALVADGTIDVSGIAGTYNDLIIIGILRGAYSGGLFESLLFRLNNDSGANYWRQRLDSNASSTTSAETGAASSSASLGSITANGGALAGSFAHAEIIIQGYASTTKVKLISSRIVTISAASAGSLFIQQDFNAWTSTAAVNRITLFGTQSASMLTGSEARIYGRT